MPSICSRHERLLRPAIFSGALLLFLCNLGRDYSWDVMERACFLKYQSQAPAWGLLFFAHLLEIPLAAGLGKLLPAIGEPLALLQIVECFFGALLVLLLYDFAVSITGRRLPSLLAAAVLAASFGFWRMATAGEEKVLSAFAITLFLYVFMLYPRDEREGKRMWTLPALYAGIVLGIASLMHLMALILWPFILIAIALQQCGLRGLRFGTASCFAIALVGMLILASAVGITAVSYYGFQHPSEILNGLLTYHSSKFPFWYFAQPAQHRSLLNNLGQSVAGIDRVVFADKVIIRHARAMASVTAIALALVGIAALKYARRNPILPLLAAFLTLWGCAFLFYEPRNPESWVCAYPAFLLLLCAIATAAGPASRRLMAPALLLALSLVVLANFRYYGALRIPNPLEPCARSLDAMATPGAVIVVGDGVEQRYMRYFSRCGIVLSGHLRSGKFDWFDTGRVDARGLKARLDLGQPTYATSLGLKRLPPDLRDGARWERLDCGRGMKLYGSKARGG